MLLVAVTGCAEGGPTGTTTDAGSRDAAVRLDARTPGTDAGAIDASASMIDAGPPAPLDGSAPLDARAPDGGACPGRMVRCGTSCVDTGTNSSHCGMCDRACAMGELCVMGACAPPAATWTTSARTFDCSRPGVIGMMASYTCPPGGSPSSLWGSGVYTSDSSICTAAVHAGHITLGTGGAITIAIRAGQSSYPGSMRNGVTSSSYGAYGCSFAVVAPACAATATDCTGLCADLMTDRLACGMCGRACGATEVCTAGTCACAAGLTLCGAAPGVCVDTTTSAANCGMCGRLCAPDESCIAGACAPRLATWTTNATDHNCAVPGIIGARFMYTCPAGGPSATAWGTDTYTSDSSICTAAVHVGRITVVAGGVVTIEMAAGATSYPGSFRNGITTSTWGTYGCSFTVP